MATVEKFVPASVEDVWAVLADPRAYAFWVVGAHDIRAADENWPEPGSRFHHTQGHGPLKLKDHTTVLTSEPPHRLELEILVRPFVEGTVDLRLRPEGEGTCISIGEQIHGGVLGLAPHFAQAPFLMLRNADGLRRLAAMAWMRSQCRT